MDNIEYFKELTSMVADYENMELERLNERVKELYEEVYLNVVKKLESSFLDWNHYKNFYKDDIVKITELLLSKRTLSELEMIIPRNIWAISIINFDKKSIAYKNFEKSFNNIKSKKNKTHISLLSKVQKEMIIGNEFYENNDFISDFLKKEYGLCSIRNFTLENENKNDVYINTYPILNEYANIVFKQSKNKNHLNLKNVADKIISIISCLDCLKINYLNKKTNKLIDIKYKIEEGKIISFETDNFFPDYNMDIKSQLVSILKNAID